MSVDLNNLKAKCRLCFQPIRAARKSVDIDEEVQEKFLTYTNLELIMSNNYSSCVCKKCVSTLNEHIKYKNNMIANQKKLYSQVDSYNLVNVNIKEEPLELNEYFPDFNHPEEFSVKMESDEDIHHEDLENEPELKVETQPVKEEQKSAKPKKKRLSEDQIQSAINAINSGQMSFEAAVRKFKISRTMLSKRIRQEFYARKQIKSDEDVETDPVPLSESLQAPQHSPDIISETLHVCDLCGFETLFKSNLIRHMTSHLEGQDITKVTCSLCKKVFLTRQIKMMHEKNHCQTSKGDFSCEKCGMNFTTKLHMINHFNADHGTFVCTNCNKVFLLKIDLFVHSTTQCDSGLKVPCKYCSKQIMQRNIRKHEELHENKLNKIFFRCDQCNYKTHVKVNLKQHVVNHSRCLDASDLVCLVCSKVFKNVATKHLHDREHTVPQGEFGCKACKKVFKVKYKLDDHFNMIHLTGNFPCNECNKVFERKQQLKIHKETHKAIVKIACEVCGKLVRKHTYLAHLKRHRPREQKCPVEGCAKLFFTKNELVEHIANRHEESKNIKCPKCASVCPTEGRLKEHLRRSHRATMLCEVEGCSYKQTRKEYLKRHLKNHKDIDTRLRDALLKKLAVQSKKK